MRSAKSPATKSLSSKKKRSTPTLTTPIAGCRRLRMSTQTKCSPPKSGASMSSESKKRKKRKTKRAATRKRSALAPSSAPRLQPLPISSAPPTVQVTDPRRISRDRDGGRRGGSRRNLRSRPNNSRNQPLITDLLKEGQEVLIQIA